MAVVAAAIIGGVAGIGGNILQSSSAKKAAKKANRLNPAQLEALARSQRVGALLEQFGTGLLTGQLSARQMREQREEAQFFAEFAKDQQREALQSQLSFLSGRGLLSSGQGVKLQARGAAEIAKVGTLTARQILSQNRQEQFQRQSFAAQLLSQFLSPGQAIANRPQTIATSTAGQAISGLGGQLLNFALKKSLTDQGDGVNIAPGQTIKPAGGGAGGSATVSRPTSVFDPATDLSRFNFGGPSPVSTGSPPNIQTFPSNTNLSGGF